MSTHATLLVIRDEHSALSAVLRSISPLLSEHRRRHTLPDFTVLRAMLFYAVLHRRVSGANPPHEGKRTAVSEGPRTKRRRCRGSRSARRRP